MEQEAARLNDRQKEIILEVSKHPTSTDVRSTSKNTEDAYLALPTRPVRQVFDLPDTFLFSSSIWASILITCLHHFDSKIDRKSVRNQ